MRRVEAPHLNRQALECAPRDVTMDIHAPAANRHRGQTEEEKQDEGDAHAHGGSQRKADTYDHASILR